MSISLEKEVTLTLPEAASRLPRLRGGKKVHVSTLYRWIHRGVGGIRLEAVKIGRTVVTSVEALQRFADRVTREPSDEPHTIENPRVEAELDRHGF